jgi:hypothetical protein
MPLPQREGDDQDFVFRLLFTMTREEVDQAYKNMLAYMKGYVPQITDSSQKQALKITERDCMTLHMLLVLISDDTNAFVQYALQQARPRSRLEYFRAWFTDFAHGYMGTCLSDKNVPDPRVMVEAARGEYIRRRDYQNSFREFWKEYVPPGADRWAGKSAPPSKCPTASRPPPGRSQ